MEKVWKMLLERLNGPILNENTAALWPSVPCSLFTRSVAQNIQEGQSFTPTCPWLVSYKTNNFQLNKCIENVFWISINNMDPNSGSHRGCLLERVKWTCLHFHLSSNISALTFDLFSPLPLSYWVSVLPLISVVLHDIQIFTMMSYLLRGHR